MRRVFDKSRFSTSLNSINTHLQKLLDFGVIYQPKRIARGLTPGDTLSERSLTIFLSDVSD